MTEETAAVFSATPFACIALVTLAVYVACRMLDARGNL